MTRSTPGLAHPFSVLIIFALFYQPLVVRTLPDSAWLRLLISPQVFFFLGVLAISFICRLKWRDLGLTRDNLKRDLGIGLGLGLAPVLLVLVVGGILNLIHSIHPFLPYPVFGGAALLTHPNWAQLTTLLLLAPLSEELFFRGILVPSLRQHYGVALTIVISALIFMGGHGNFAVGPLVLGLINAWIYLRYGSLIPCIVFHLISNAYGPIMIEWFPNLYRYLHVLY